MNRLQKKAWVELIACGVMIVLITIPAILFLASRNARGLDYLLIALIVGAPTGLIAYLIELKKLNDYDEREKEIIRKAFMLSMMIFVFYLFVFAFTAFFLIGGKEKMPVVFLPLMVLTGIFLAQCVQSAALLIQCSKEEDDE